MSRVISTTLPKELARSTWIYCVNTNPPAGLLEDSADPDGVLETLALLSGLYHDVLYVIPLAAETEDNSTSLYFIRPEDVGKMHLGKFCADPPKGVQVVDPPDWLKNP